VPEIKVDSASVSVLPLHYRPTSLARRDLNPHYSLLQRRTPSLSHQAHYLRVRDQVQLRAFRFEGEVTAAFAPDTSLIRLRSSRRGEHSVLGRSTTSLVAGRDLNPRFPIGRRRTSPLRTGRKSVRPRPYSRQLGVFSPLMLPLPGAGERSTCRHRTGRENCGRPRSRMAIRCLLSQRSNRGAFAPGAAWSGVTLLPRRG
jgi:hypothetical protein